MARTVDATPRIAGRTSGLGLLVLVVLLGACGDDALDPEVPADSLPVMVSDAAPLAGVAAEMVTWVALPPGTIADGVDAAITTRLGNGHSTVPVVDGGFDPVPLPALVGDTVVVEVRDADDDVITVTLPVPLRAMPIVVRTDPPKKKKDVPLNLRALVVFSEPMDPETVDTATIRLLRGGVAVRGTVTLTAAGWQAVVVPDVALDPLTDYVLEVTTDVTDRAGDRLETALTVDFTTGVTQVAQVTLVPDSLSLMPGQRLALGARVTSSTGGPLYRMVSWRSSDTAVATIDAAGRVTALRGGDATITAVVEGVSGTARLQVAPDFWRLVAASEYHTCAVGSDDQTYCWGHDPLGILGIPADTTCGLTFLSGTIADSACVTVPRAVSGAPRLGSLAGGAWFTCGLTDGGRANCWGILVGYGVTASAVTFDGYSFVALTAGGRHACALTVEGVAYCWGDNSRGQLGDSTKTSRSAPLPVAGGHRFSTISAGGNTTCALENGNAWCWGDNTFGQLGNGRKGGSEEKVAPIQGPEIAFETVALGSRHACGLSGGTAYCWASNAEGQLGTGSSDTAAVTAPVPVQTSAQVWQLSAGGGGTCAISVDRVGYCWGSYALGEYSPSYLPAQVAAVEGARFQDLQRGEWHACGITLGGQVLCWGDDVGAQTRPFRRP